jgi:hypothetical protein
MTDIYLVGDINRIEEVGKIHVNAEASQTSVFESRMEVGRQSGTLFAQIL